MTPKSPLEIERRFVLAIKKNSKIFFTGTLSGSGPEIHKLVDATEKISVRTTSYKLSFLMNFTTLQKF